MSDIDKLNFNELQEKILTSDITNNPLMTSSKIDTKNKTLPTKCKGVVQSISETYKKVQQLEKYETDFAVERQKPLFIAHNQIICAIVRHRISLGILPFSRLVLLAFIR